MKKILTLVLAVSVMSFIGCGNEKEQKVKNDNYMKPLSESINEGNEIKEDDPPTEQSKAVDADLKEMSDDVEQVEIITPVITDSDDIKTDDLETDISEVVDTSVYEPLVEDKGQESDTEAEIAVQKKGLLIHESGYIDPDAQEEISKIQSFISSSDAWNKYQQYSDGAFAVPIENFNVSRDGGGGYILDYYAPGAFRIEIRNTDNEIGIYLLNDNMETIQNFLQ